VEIKTKKEYQAYMEALVGSNNAINETDNKIKEQIESLLHKTVLITSIVNIIILLINTYNHWMALFFELGIMCYLASLLCTMFYNVFAHYVYTKRSTETHILRENINNNELNEIEKEKINKQIIKNNTFPKYLNKFNLFKNVFAILSIIFMLSFYIVIIF
jgi:uncharacterized protein YacL